MNTNTINRKHTRIISSNRSLEWVKPGALAVLCEESYEGSTGSHFYLIPGDEGIGGNMNSEVKCFHGWRGTSYGRSVYAHGLREILAVEVLRADDYDGWKIRVTLSKDLKPEEA